MGTMPLTATQRRRRPNRLRAGSDARQARRLTAVLELDRGRTVAQVADLLGTTRQTVYNWAHRPAARPDPVGLRDGYGTGRPSSWTEGLRAVLRDSLARRPDRLGYQAVTWTVGLLRERLGRQTGQWLSDDAVRRELDRLGYVWKRYRYVLPPDPEREKKTRHFAAVAGVAGPGRQAGRGRDRPAAVPAFGGRVGQAG